MKTQYTLMVLGVIAAASLISVSAFNGLATTYSVANTDGVKTGISILGHLELVATDADGYIISYQQTDNAIVEQGVDCIVQKLFRDPLVGGGSVTCGGDSGQFDVIQIGIGTDGTPDAATGVATPATLAGLSAAKQDPDGVTVADTTGTGATGVVSVSFTNTAGAGSESITEAIILNATSGIDNALAYRTFTGIPLDDTDQLTVTWTITVAEG